MLDVLIVGAGPAGLSAAIYTARAGLNTKVVVGDSVGGLLTTTEQIDNYLGLYGSTGMDMADNFKNHAEKFGAELVYDTVEEIVEASHTFTTVLKSGESILSKSVIFAAGSTPKKLGIEGEDLSGVSYCSTCDGDFFYDESVALIGGGETAAEDALYLAQICQKVDILVRGTDWRASAPAVQKLIDHPKVNIHMSTFATEILGKEEVSGISLNNGETLDVQGVFIAIGQSPNSETAKGHTTLFSDGFIQCSNMKGFFVAGDIGNPEYRQVAIAVGDGAKAGIETTRYILNN